MRILAMSFLTEESAAVAQRALDRRFGAAHGVRLAPLGRLAGRMGPSTVLAGRFEDEVTASVREVVAELGGTVVVDVDALATGNA